ncbi:zinc metalloprotease [Nocardioides panacis]|uniref:Zinc metalloprotease n=1 Tax=Nocardioides panacis TaxID=2849501 RepID=A0A975T038_9ACTN|nr:zinc metalloprotease [Nocardioides panacis]QWZ09119.1 zinc metalloprotease [Nocardioides panacis]
MTALRHRTAALAGLTALVGSLSFAGALAPAQAAEPASSRAASCFDPTAVGAGTGGAAAARGGRSGLDHRDLTPAQQASIEKRTRTILADRRGKPGGGGTGGTVAAGPVPVYIHVMADANGNGDVTDAQITAQIAELNQDFAGGESTSSANTGFSFTLAGTDRYYNTQWHQDKSSTTYRSQTRRGGANALNIWLVDFAYLGVATFPWDYAKNPSIDGIRVEYSSLPGGSATNYNEGKTASHEAGHWFGLYHTFQGGCTSTNDEVADTPAQSSATSGCPEGRDSCALPGLDPIHNYMDYSYDPCYNQFTPNQATRTQQMFSAYRS